MKPSFGISEVFRAYSLLLKSRVNRSEIIPVSFSLNTLIAYTAASVLTGRDLLSFSRDAVLVTLAMLATALSVYIYNDLTDMDIDRLNKLDRALAAGKVSPKDARNFIVILGILGLASGFVIGSKFFLLLFTYFALFSIYSFPLVRLKNKFLLNKITVGIGTTISYLLGGAAVGEIPAPIFIMAAFGFVATVGSSTVLDLRDIEGDKIHKIKTLPVVWGPELTIRFCIALICLAGAATTLGYYQLGFNIAFQVLAPCVFVAWIFILYPLFQHWTDSSYVKNAVVKKIAPLGFLVQTLTLLGAVVSR